MCRSCYCRTPTTGWHDQGVCDRINCAQSGVPTVPTTGEAGLPEFQASGWFALFAPKATPKPILDKLTDALDRALGDEGTRKRLVELGSDVPDRSRRGQQALGVLLKSEIARWMAIIQAAKVKAE